MARGLDFRESATPPPAKGGGVPALPQFWGFLSIYACTPFVAELPNLTWYSTRDEGAWVKPRLPSPHSGVSALPTFEGSPAFTPTSFNAEQIRHGNTYREGRVFRRSATPLRLQKCVARFVSDSR